MSSCSYWRRGSLVKYPHLICFSPESDAGEHAISCVVLAPSGGKATDTGHHVCMSVAGQSPSGHCDHVITSRSVVVTPGGYRMVSIIEDVLLFSTISTPRRCGVSLLM